MLFSEYEYYSFVLGKRYFASLMWNKNYHMSERTLVHRYFFVPEMMSDVFVCTWGDAQPETEQPELLMPLFTNKYQIQTLVFFILGVFIITVESFLREKAKFWNIIVGILTWAQFLLFLWRSTWKMSNSKSVAICFNWWRLCYWWLCYWWLCYQWV